MITVKKILIPMLLLILVENGFAQSGSLSGPTTVCVNEAATYVATPGQSPQCQLTSGNVAVLDAVEGIDYEKLATTAGSITVKFLHAGSFTIETYFQNCTPTERQLYVTVRPEVAGFTLPQSSYQLEFLESENIILKLPNYAADLNWYESPAGTLIGTGTQKIIGVKNPGVYNFEAEVINTYECTSQGTPITSATVQVTVNTIDDDMLNWVESKGFTQGLQQISHSKSYFDISGKMLQSQTKSYSSTKIWTSQSVEDKYGRAVLSSLSAPIEGTSFQYKHRFITNSDGQRFSYQDIGEPLGTDAGTVGWYYSANNSMEDHVPVTGYPYATSEFYNDGTGEARKSAGPGEVHRMGAGHEVLSGTFPVFSELDDYLLKRRIAIPGIVQDGSLKNEGSQTVSRDQNGQYVVTITDKSGKNVFSARKGTKDEFTLRVSNHVVANANDENATEDLPVAYLYLLDPQPVGLSDDGAVYTVEDIVSDQEFDVVTDVDANGNWPAGFYRVIVTEGEVTLDYSNFFLDVSYSFYDDAGRLICSLSPNGQASLPTLSYGQHSSGKPWMFGASQMLGGGDYLNVTLDVLANPDGSKMAYSKFRMPPGTYEVTGTWARNVLSGAGTYTMTFYLLDENLNILDSELASLNSTFNGTTVSLTATDEVYYIGAKASAIGSGSVYIEGNVHTGRIFDFNVSDKTTYAYNFRGWLLQMTETDAGTTSYQYRKDGSIRFSQNAQQYIHDNATPRVAGKGKFSYTQYDDLGRPVESGEYTGNTLSFTALNGQLEYGDQVTYNPIDKKDWVKTHYDYPDANFISTTGLSTAFKQTFVRGGVSWTENANIKTWYSYDELGRVRWMAQKPAMLPRVFVVKYNYDFLGNVLQVANLSYDVSGTLIEQFYHHYNYDADQRLDKAYTSLTETGSKKLRATYTYYLHGPLKRIELGDNLQGIDFVYNIHGWLTQINHPDPAQDPGGDGNDVFGMVLDYYESDLSNLFSSSAGGLHDPSRRHNLPSNLWAVFDANHQPLIRFNPEISAEKDPLPFKEYSAENERYRKMISAPASVYKK